MHEERQESQRHRQEEGQDLSEDSFTPELTTVHRCPFLPLGISGSAATMTTMTTTTTVSIDAALEAATVSLGNENCSVGSDVDTAAARRTTKAKRLAIAAAEVVYKTHAAVSRDSLPLISSSSDVMPTVAADDDTARLRSKEDEKWTPAQPSSFSLPSSSSLTSCSSTSFSVLCRTFKQNPRLIQNTTILEQHLQQATPTASSSLAPCSSSASSPSTSTSSTFVEGSLDEVLLTALQNRQDRLFLLKLEREYCNFIENPSKDVLEFPWLNSYFRMMIHRSAMYYRLARTVDAAQKKIVLSKTEHTAIPALRLQELVEEDDVPVKSFKVLRRSPLRPVSACEARGSTMTGTTIPGVASSAPTQSSPWQGPGGQLSGGGSTRRGIGGTLEQREAAYAKARARIFDTGEENEEEKGKDLEEHQHSCQDASSIPRGEPRRSPSVTSGTSSSTARTVASTVDSLSRLELGQGHSQGHGHSKARSDITRRTSTSSTISSSSSSSGTTMADISARTDFVGSWMMGGGGHYMPHPPSDLYDHRSVARNNASYCECGADHGSVGHDIATGAQLNNPSRRASCACHHHRHQPQESHHHHHSAVCSCQNSHGSSQQGSSSMRHPSSVHGGYPAASTLPRHPQQQRQQQHQQQRLFSPCNQQHYPQQYQHHPHQHLSHQHQHQHHPGYQHPVQYGHAHVCARLDPQAQHQHLHQGHQQHRQPHYNQQNQTHHYQQPHQPHCFFPHHTSSQHLHQHNRGSGGSNSGFQDPRWVDCISRPEIQPSHHNVSPANSVSGMVMESNPTTTQDVPPPHPGLFQVSVRPYPSSNGYRPYRQGISLPQQMTRQAQQRQHRHTPGQGQTQGQQGQGQNQSGQRQHQQRQQGSAPNTRQQQQQQRGQQQPQPHQPQKLSVRSIDHPHSPAPSSSSSSSSSSKSSSSSTKRHSYGGNEGRKEERGPSSYIRHHNHRQQEEDHRQQEEDQRQDTMKSREVSVHVPITVYDVERRPPKSTELYDPYATTNTPACGSGSKSRDRHKH
ncbi:MAG: hypothetical protein JOS17DRAFT_748103 [Linnemannia elongata]|nr:MAG: hypothetical protein JOS17DRAFT_748103 [Linnemannia elongata]